MAMDNPQDRFRRIANAYQITCAVQAGAALGLGVHLVDAPRPVAEIAERLGAKTDPLRRLLRFLGVLGVVEFDEARDAARRVELTDLMTAGDNIAEGPEAVRAWLRLPDAVLNDDDAFAAANGAAFYDYAAAHPLKAARLAARNRQTARAWAPRIAEALDLSDAETIADLGGGAGDLAIALLEANPGLRATVVELPHARAEIEENIQARGVGDGLRFVAGDLRRAPPPPADVYILCRVLLNAPDEDARQVLDNCRNAMTAGSRLFVIEALTPDEPGAARNAGFAHDLHLFALWRGKQRACGDYDALLRGAGLARANRIDARAGDHPEAPPLFSILECRLD